MPEYTIDLPEEIINIIKLQGYSVDGYIQTMLINPLVKKLKARMEIDALVLVREDIDNSVSKANSKIKIKKVTAVVENATTK